MIVDEIQKVPALIDEVHWLLENTDKSYILCGSSARKLKKEAKNLLGGRAVSYHMYPLTTHELPDFDLARALNFGLLPAHYLQENPATLLRSYVGNYLREEIINETATRNVPAFSRFLEALGYSHGELINYANIARDCGVSSSSVRSYFEILDDTLLGFRLDPWRKKNKRTLTKTSKYYLFDVGVANYLNPENTQVIPGNEQYGIAFEHFILGEVQSYLHYNNLDYQVRFWRTQAGAEVDIVIGDMQVAIECKSGKRFRGDWLKGLKALAAEQSVRRSILVTSVDQAPRVHDGIESFHWKQFCERLWSGQIVS